MNKESPLHAVLLHGMGRTPAAMSILAARLRVNTIRPHLFAYSVTFERWENCTKRLERFIEKRVQGNDYIMIGHSMGTVLTRAIVPTLIHKPSACFFLAPPTRVCKAARILTPHPLVKLLAGDFGRILGNDQFMESLPAASVPTKIYAGTAGPRGRFSPFGNEPNDGVLTLNEVSLPGVPVQTVHILHPFIMNSKIVSQDIVRIVRAG
jgi:hypothetical protein